MEWWQTIAFSPTGSSSTGWLVANPGIYGSMAPFDKRRSYSIILRPKVCFSAKKLIKDLKLLCHPYCEYNGYNTTTYPENYCYPSM